MTRISKQGEIRSISRKKPRLAGPKTGPKKDALEAGYKPHENAIAAVSSANRFIPKVR